MAPGVPAVAASKLDDQGRARCAGRVNMRGAEGDEGGGRDGKRGVAWGGGGVGGVPKLRCGGGKGRKGRSVRRSRLGQPGGRGVDRGGGRHGSFRQLHSELQNGGGVRGALFLSPPSLSATPPTPLYVSLVRGPRAAGPAPHVLHGPASSSKGSLRSKSRQAHSPPQRPSSLTYGTSRPRPLSMQSCCGT